MNTRTRTVIKVKTDGGFNMDMEYPKGINIKGIVLDLINWAADDNLDEFQAKINERIEFIKLNS